MAGQSDPEAFLMVPGRHLCDACTRLARTAGGGTPALQSLLAECDACCQWAGCAGQHFFRKAAELHHRGRHQQALVLVDRACSLRPDRTECISVRGSIHFKLENWRQAMRDLTTVIDVGVHWDGHWDALCMRSTCCLQLGDVLGAFRDCATVVRDATPGDHPHCCAILQLAELHCRSNMTHMAREALAGVERPTEPMQSWVMYMTARMHKQEGLIGLAELQFTMAAARGNSKAPGAVRDIAHRGLWWHEAQQLSLSRLTAGGAWYE